MRTIFSLILILSFIYNAAYTQVSVNTDGSPPDPSAIFDIKSQTKGFLLPRMNLNKRSSIVNPAEGLMVFCTNCGLDGTGMLCMFTGGEWFSFSICKISPPTASVNLLPSSSIVWNWNPVPGASGYKWGTTMSLASAVDVGTDTSKLETGITCDILYTRYVWAYSNCGYSAPLTLTQSNPNCWTCGQAISINHIAGSVAPVNKSTSYGTVSNIPGETSKCWITSNLGSDNQATAVNDVTEASAGWYWQFNRMQGFKHDGTTRTPNTTWINSISEYTDWITANDPCAIELGTGWRIPTNTEWVNVDAAGSWTNYNGPWNSALKIHPAGRLYYSNGDLSGRGSEGRYWSSSQYSLTHGYHLYISSANSITAGLNKSFGYSIRCIKD